MNFIQFVMRVQRSRQTDELCLSELTTNLGAVLTLLLHVRKRHPSFRGHGVQHGSPGSGNAVGDESKVKSGELSSNVRWKVWNRKKYHTVQTQTFELETEAGPALK